MRVFADQQRNPNKIHLAPIKESLRSPDPVFHPKFPAERFNKNLLREGPQRSSQNSIPVFSETKKNPDFNQSTRDALKNLETIESLRKRQAPSKMMKNDSDRLLPVQTDEFKANLALIEEKRKSFELSSMKDLQKTGKMQESDFQRNISKFYAVDEEVEEELPNQSEFQNDSRMQRFAKTNLKTIVHDPITGTTLNYANDRIKPRALGSKPLDVFPGKINDSPPQVKYELPRNTKKSPKSMIFNPLTHETIRFENQNNIFVESNKGKVIRSEGGFRGFNY
jgi:hypothetical protein